MNDQPTEELIHRAVAGDQTAVPILFDQCRPRLRQMVEARIDPRLLARIDPSDVVQEALIDAVRMLPDYLRERPLPFYPWVRQIAWNRLIDLHRQHVRAKRRTVSREVSFHSALSSKSQYQIANQILARNVLPHDRLMLDELIERLQRAILKLVESHQEILILRHLEGLSVAETADVLKITELAVTSRHFRALSKLREILDHSE